MSEKDEEVENLRNLVKKLQREVVEKDEELDDLEGNLEQALDSIKNFHQQQQELFENFVSFWSVNTEAIIKDKVNSIKSNYDMIQSFLFYILFYFCISMIFLSKKLVNRGINLIKTFLLILSIFLYYLLIPKVILNNFQLFFQIISIIIFILIFFKIKSYE